MRQLQDIEMAESKEDTDENSLILGDFKHKEPICTEEEEQQLALVKSNQAINRHDVNQFDLVVNSVADPDLPKLLFDSCEKGLIEHVDKILKLNCDVALTTECKKPELYPILVAARKGNYQIIDSLLKKMYALNKLNVGLKQTNTFGDTIFHIIMKSVSNSRDRYYKSLEVLMKYKEYFEDNLIIKKDYSLICDASEVDLCDFVELLLQKGANPLKYFKTRNKKNPLQLACSNGNDKIAKILINHIQQKETNGNETLKDFLNYKDECGNTALHMILSGKAKEIKEKNKTYDPENKKRVEETHMDAADDNYLSCMELVLSKKEFIDIDAVNNVGNTALHKATKLFKNQRFAKLLLYNGARTDIKNKNDIIAEVSNVNKKADDVMKNNTDQKLDVPSQNLTSIPNDIVESTNLPKEALTNGYYLEVQKSFDVIKKRQKLSDKVIRSFLDIIVESCENTEKLNQSNANNSEKEKNVKNIKKHKRNNNVDFNKCMDIVLKYNMDVCSKSNAQVIIDQVLFNVCERGISNLVEPLLKNGANYIQPISKNHKNSSLQIAFKKGYYIIAKELLEYDSSLHLQSDYVKKVLENIVNGLKEKNEMQCRGANKKGKREKQEKKNREIFIEKENEHNYKKCFEILFEPNCQFHNYEIKSDQIFFMKLFYEICSNGWTQLAACLLDLDVDPCLEFEDDQKYIEISPIHIASICGYHKLVELLLKKMKARGEKKLKEGLQKTNKWGNLTIHNVVRSVAMKNKNDKKQEDLCPEIDYYKCLQSLLGYKEHYNIDAQDCHGNTALHYATHSRDNQQFIKLLLMNGSQMTIKNKKLITAKSKIAPSLIEEILDSCIKADGDESVVDDLRLTIDLNIFAHKHEHEPKTETELITTLRESSHYKHLLSHPVISTFLYIKWQKIRTFWYINQLFYSLFFSCLISYVCYMESEPNHTAKMISLKVIISMIGVYMLIREIVQFFIFKLAYFKSFDNLLEISLLIMTGLLLYVPDPDIQNVLKAWIVVGSIAEFILLFGKIPLFQCSIYITMFKKVTFHFLKIIGVLFFWIILAFSFSFFILFHQNANFTTFSKSLLTTAVMSTGEIDYTSLPFDSSGPVSTRLLFAIFIFVIVFIAVNLMNGIAISDIQDIQKEAENHAIMAEAECIIGINKTLSMLINKLHFRCLKRIWNRCLIFDDCFIKKSISLFPNRHYEHVWATCEGHSCNNTKINHCPYYFWLNIQNFKDLLYQLRFINKCNDCKIYYDKRVVQTKSQNDSQSNRLHKCSKTIECAVCKRYMYTKESSKHIHKCLHRHRYYIKNMSVKEAKDIVTKQRQQKAEKEKEKRCKIVEDMQIRQSQISKEEKQKREQLQTSVNELTEIIKKMQTQNKQ